jgi:hypothetical protein
MADASLRPGEACGLQWKDLGSETLRVERSVEDSGRVKSLKTDKGRTVDLSARAAAALRDLQALAEAEALASGKDMLPWIFATRAGTPPRPHRIAKTFRKVARAAALPTDLTLYSLRHTFVSHLIASRAPITYIANQVGHSKVITTLTFYAHLFANGDRRHIEEMERARLLAVPAAVDVVPDDAELALDDDQEWPRFGPGRKTGAPDDSEAPDLIGGPSRTRTLDPLNNGLRVSLRPLYKVRSGTIAKGSCAAYEETC